MGIERFNDPYAFFPRNPGVTGIIKTNDKRIIIGQRNVQPDKYDGLLQGAAGHLEFRQDPKDIILRDDLYRELNEETGVSKNQVTNLEFLGLFSDPSVGGDDLDFCYLVDVDLPSNYFSEGGWKEIVPEKQREHSQFFAIHNYNDLKELLNSGKFENREFDIVFSTCGPLEQLVYKDFK